jgi:hypothetical protein
MTTNDTLNQPSATARGFLALAPLAVALIVFAWIVGPMLIRQEPIGAWVLGAFLVAHGLIHAMFIPRQSPTQTPTRPGDYPFSFDRSWLVTRFGLSRNVVRPLGLAFTAVTVAGFVLAALCTIGVALPASLWSPLVAVSSLASLLVLLIAFAPSLVLGIAIDVVLLWMALASEWQPNTPVV